MSKINILDSSVFNRIAAGEVVERPASVVKELLENSIDAGATKIVLEIYEGGIKRIKIADNGSGIEAEDLPRAFLPHATSKVKYAEDLEKIGTLGFRGEALASIAAVSKVYMISKPKDQQNGHSISLEGGIITENEPKGSPDGTFINIDSLFYNVPARAKFLKKPQQEAAEITNLVSRLILANPNIAFDYSIDAEQIFMSSGKGLDEAIYAVYGKQTTDNLIKVSDKLGSIKISGVIGKPSFAKANRTYQTLIINGRYVVNSTVSAAVYNAFENYMMKNRFPFFVLNISVPLDEIDVNVHPKKLEVRFENGQAVYLCVNNAVGKALLNSSNIASLAGNWGTAVEKKTESVNPISQDTFNKSFSGVSFKSQENTDNIQAATPIHAEIESQNTNFNSKQSNENAVNSSEALSAATDRLAEVLADKNFSGVKSDNGVFARIAENLAKQGDQMHIETEQIPVQNIQSALNIDFMYKYAGKLFNTYLVFEHGEKAYFIDQHAAHERLLFDKLKEQVNSTTGVLIQPLLIPYVLNINHIEAEFIKNNIPLVMALGFEIEEFGTASFKISAVPLTLKNIDIGAFFNSVLKDMSAFTAEKTSDFTKDMLAQMACKAAIKSGDDITEADAQNILKNLQTNKTTLLCPHGRPIVVEVKRTDIDKWFKRIL